MTLPQHGQVDATSGEVGSAADAPARAFQAVSRQAGRPVLSLATDNCAAEAERLKAKGVMFVKEPYRRDYGGIDAVFTDTCGNLLNLHQD